MLLITAALKEELRVAIDLCCRPARVTFGASRLWQGYYRDATVYFLRTGIGPLRAGKRLECLLAAFRPTRILVTGYAGALEPSLRPGDLVVGKEACIFGMPPDSNLPIEHLELGGCWETAGTVTASKATEQASRRGRVTGSSFRHPEALRL